jgi:NADPH2:quinone reductase
MTVAPHGGFAAYACLLAVTLRPVPAGMPLKDAAAFNPGETALVRGAAGGVGTAGVQTAKAAGARVIAAVFTDETAALCRRIGANTPSTTPGRICGTPSEASPANASRTSYTTRSAARTPSPRSAALPGAEDTS